MQGFPQKMLPKWKKLCCIKFQVDTVLYEFLQWSIKERYVGMKETTDYFSKAWDFVQKEVGITCSEYTTMTLKLLADILYNMHQRVLS